MKVMYKWLHELPWLNRQLREYLDHPLKNAKTKCSERCNSLFVCLFLWTPSFEGNRVSLMGCSLTSRAGIDGNAPYQAKELHITTLANPGIQTNVLPPRLV